MAYDSPTMEEWLRQQRLERGGSDFGGETDTLVSPPVVPTVDPGGPAYVLGQPIDDDAIDDDDGGGGGGGGNDPVDPPTGDPTDPKDPHDPDVEIVDPFTTTHPQPWPPPVDYKPVALGSITPFDWTPTTPPPPPAPPAAPPPPANFDVRVGALGPLPQFQAPGDVAAAPDYQGITDNLQGFSAPGAPADAQDFVGVAGDVPGFQAPGAPGAAPDYAAITSALGDFQRPEDLAAAQDFTGITEGAPGFVRPDSPDAAPDYASITEGLDRFVRPDAPGAAPDFTTAVPGAYETPEGTFLGEDMYGPLSDYSRSWMDTPNRYLSETALATRSAGDARIAEAQRLGNINIGEWASGRGLVGSSYEGEQQVDLAASLDRNRRDQEAEILKYIADAETADRERAGRFGIDTGRFGLDLGDARRSEARIAQELALQRGSLEVTAKDRADAAELRRSQLGLDTERAVSEDSARRAGLELTAADLGEQGTQFRSSLGLDTERTAAEAAARTTGLELSGAQAAEQSAIARGGLSLDTERAASDAAARTAGLALSGAEAADRGAMERGRLGLATEAEAADQAVRRGSLELQAKMSQEEATQFRADLGLRTAKAGADVEAQQAGLKLSAAQMEQASNEFKAKFSLEVARDGFDAAFRNVELQQRDGIQRAQLSLQAAIAGDRAAMDRVRFELDTIRVMDAALLDRAQIEQQNNQIALRAYEVMTNAELQGQRLEFDQARWVSEIDLRNNELQQRDEQSRREEAGRAERHADWLDVEMGKLGFGPLTDEGGEMDPSKDGTLVYDSVYGKWITPEQLASNKKKFPDAYK